jgi:hypothetical protein
MRPIVYPASAADVLAGFTPPLPVDYNRVTGQYGLQYLTAGGAAGTGTLQYTLDDPFNPPAGGLTWTAIALVNGRANINQAVRAFRVLTPVLNDVATIVAQGSAAAG